MKGNYISYYLPTVIENEMKYILFSPPHPQSQGFFPSWMWFFPPAVCSFGMQPPLLSTWRHPVRKHPMEKKWTEKVYYFFKIYCKNTHFQLFIAALAGILACNFVIYSEHST